jgi:probable O-glycosylation ligase (exosortase A-associated)
MVGSVSFVAFKASFMMTITGSFHLSGITSGFVGDNNTLGLCLCLTTAALFGLFSTVKNVSMRTLLVLLIIFDILLILITQSRGAFLTMGIIAILSIISSKKPILYLIILATVITISYQFLPKDMFSRLNTLENVEDDTSAMTRVDMWKRAFTISKTRPLTGVGVGGFQFFSRVNFPGQPAFVTHSVYMQLLSSVGYPGLLLYILIILKTIANLHYLARIRKKNQLLDEEHKWISSVGFWLRNAFIGYLFGSAFLDMLPYDIPWYLILYSNVLYYIVKTYENSSLNTLADIQGEDKVEMTYNIF